MYGDLVGGQVAFDNFVHSNQKVASDFWRTIYDRIGAFYSGFDDDGREIDQSLQCGRLGAVNGKSADLTRYGLTCGDEDNECGQDPSVQVLVHFKIL